jgi:tetrahydromethanopterin S-methyltransferase subunit D
LVQGKSKMSDHTSNGLSRRTFIGNSALAAGALVTGIAANAAQAKSRPNILFIMTDDHAA